MRNAVAAIAHALKDVLGGKLGWLALLCLVVAASATIGAAWASLHFLVPLIAEAAPSFTLFGASYDTSTAASWLASAVFVILSIVLSPAVSMIVGGALFDVAAARVEKEIGALPGRMVALHEGLLTGLRIALPALVFNVLAIPFYFVPVVNVIVFWGLNGFLMGREYSALAAVRRVSWAEARALRRRNGAAIFLVGLVCSFIPFVAPLVGASAMTRLVTSLSSRSNTR